MIKALFVVMAANVIMICWGKMMRWGWDLKGLGKRVAVGVVAIFVLDFILFSMGWIR